MFFRVPLGVSKPWPLLRFSVVKNSAVSPCPLQKKLCPSEKGYMLFKSQREIV